MANETRPEEASPVGEARREAWRAWGVWALFLAVVLAVKWGEAPRPEAVFSIYRNAALRFGAGEPLYAGGRFLYFPTAAALFAPLTELPYALGAGLWRSLNLVVFAAGVQALCRSLPGGGQKMLVPVSLVSAALAWSAARHGQMTLCMGGCMMLGAAAVQRAGEQRAALWLALGVALKPHALALQLVVAAGSRPAFAYFGLASLGAVLLLFVGRDGGYVLAQLATLPQIFELRMDWGDQRPSPHVFGLLATLGIVVSTFTRNVLRVACALAVLEACRRLRRGAGPEGVALPLYALSTFAILLLGHGTERSTYALMAPVLGIALFRARHEGRRAATLACAGVLVACLVSHPLARLFPGTPLTMLKPLACCALLWILAQRRAARVASSWIVRPVLPGSNDT